MWSPATTGLAGPSMADLVAMAAMDGPLCRKFPPINFAINTYYRLIMRYNEWMLVSLRT